MRYIVRRHRSLHDGMFVGTYLVGKATLISPDVVLNLDFNSTKLKCWNDYIYVQLSANLSRSKLKCICCDVLADNIMTLQEGLARRSMHIGTKINTIERMIHLRYFFLL